jgi:Mrp family chromosome partitioning ATPase
MRRLIDEAAAQYDWVIIDAPPVSVLPDAQHLARLADGILFVIGAAATPYSLIDRALNELGRDKVLGTILNRSADTAVAAAHYYGEDY